VEPIGVYIHIPFCRRKCFYCDFPSVEGGEGLVGRYVSALTREIASCGKTARGADVASIYIGGGTPSILDSEQVSRFLHAVIDNFTVRPGAEISVEMNPESVTMEKLAGYRAGGVNRASVGVQSLDDDELKFLERVHDADQARKAVEMAKDAGFENVSVDLMFAIPGQTVKGWTERLREAADWGVTHISCYELTPEPGTRLAVAVARGEIRLPENGADFFDETERTLESLGFVHYEISNYAKQGFECVHNVGYWEYRDYIGAGAGACCTMSGVRTENVRDPQKYIERVETSVNAVSKVERLTPENMRLERLMMGLRLKDGIQLADVGMTENIETLVNDGFLEIHGGRLKATARGWRVLNLVLERV
jgi:oxygen-independent coproporphyrinogen-3 oxidase